MTQAELIEFVAEGTGCSKAKVGRCIKALVQEWTMDLQAGLSVPIPGFVIVKPVTRAAIPERPGRNPSTGEAMTFPAVPERLSVKARMCAELKRALN
jgi:nucleoid DNA-binding protein